MDGLVKSVNAATFAQEVLQVPQLTVVDCGAPSRSSATSRAENGEEVKPI